MPQIDVLLTPTHYKHLKLSKRLNFINRMKTINFPCVMLEKKFTVNTHITESILNESPFALITNETELQFFGKLFTDPVITHFYSVVNQAKQTLKVI